jgi:hypothetical protein
MKSLSEKMAIRRQRNRPRTTVEIRIPQDVLEDLEEMAPLFGMGSGQALMRAYISEGMRKDESALNQPEVREMLEMLKRDGVPNEVISERLAETLQKIA